MTIVCLLCALFIIKVSTTPRSGVMRARGPGDRIDVDKIVVTASGHLALKKQPLAKEQ